jgi:hypothetical protein
MSQTVRLNMTRSGDATNWKCRVCGFERFYRVVVTRANNQQYHTQFFACSQCQVMFHNPANFNSYNDKPIVDVRPSQEFRIKAVK